MDNVWIDSIGIYDEEEIYTGCIVETDDGIHENCTVQVWRNSVTGEESIGWWENGCGAKMEETE